MKVKFQSGKRIYRRVRREKQPENIQEFKGFLGVLCDLGDELFSVLSVQEQNQQWPVRTRVPIG